MEHGRQKRQRQHPRVLWTLSVRVRPAPWHVAGSRVESLFNKFSSSRLTPFWANPANS